MQVLKYISHEEEPKLLIEHENQTYQVQGPVPKSQVTCIASFNTSHSTATLSRRNLRPTFQRRCSFTSIRCESTLQPCRRLIWLFKTLSCRFGARLLQVASQRRRPHPSCQTSMRQTTSLRPHTCSSPNHPLTHFL